MSFCGEQGFCQCRQIPIALAQELACSSSQLTTQDRDKWHWSQWGVNDAPPIGLEDPV